MSLILSNSLADGRQEVFCSTCKSSVGILDPGELGEMSAAGVEVRCWVCTEDADFIPKQLWYEDDVFLLGIDDVSFIASWAFGGLDCEPTELTLKPITAAAWYALKTGDIRMLAVKQSLSSSPKLITLDLKEWGQDA